MALGILLFFASSSKSFWFSGQKYLWL